MPTTAVTPDVDLSAAAAWPLATQDVAELLVSELVSNAVLHGAPPVMLVHLTP